MAYEVANRTAAVATRISKPVTPRQMNFARWEHRLVSRYVHTKTKTK